MSRTGVGERPEGAVAPGATVAENGVTFGVWSGHATGLWLCLFDEAGEETRIPMFRGEGGMFGVFLRSAREGLRYGYRAEGPWQPRAGHRFNHHKLLLDPYARRMVGSYDPEGPVVDHRSGRPDELCTEDSAPFVPRSVVTKPLPALAVRPPRPLAEQVIYEAHVARFTEICPPVSLEHRGRFPALESPAIVGHLRSLGVTTLELLPVQTKMSEPHLLRRGLRNEWGYSPVGFLALSEELAPLGEDPRWALRRAALSLREHGIETWLDVVFNHTAELDLDGPTFHLRGLDHKSYYRLDDRGRPLDLTGCGNTLNAEHPRVVQLVLDSLRELVLGCGVSGFRFDLGLTLGRVGELPPAEALRTSPLFRALREDPWLSRVHLVVEPWDARGYALGAFPDGVLEWNDRYRDGVRRLFVGDGRARGDFATRIAGSSDVFQERGPLSAVNFVTAHDGFTLADLVSYERKHNEANGEENRDGHEPNYSENFGVEGPTDDAAIRARRLSKQKALLLTLFVSAGVPMLAMGDEFSRTQHGNNNAYCLAYPMSWAATPQALTEFVRRLATLRASLTELRRTEFYSPDDLQWFEPDGSPVREWQRELPALAAMLKVSGGALWLAWNGGRDPRKFTPPERFSTVHELLRSDEGLCAEEEDPRTKLTLAGRSAAAVWFAHG